MKYHHRITGLQQRQALFDSLRADTKATYTRPGSLKHGDQHQRQKGRTMGHKKNRRGRMKP